MKSLTRRSVLKGALVCSASAAFARVPHATFPVDPRARLAVATYPFREFIIAPENHDYDPKMHGMDLASFARFVRTEFKVNGIEPLDSHFPSTEPREVRKLRAAFDTAGVYTVNIPVDEKVELCSDDAAIRSVGNARYRAWIDVAVLLGSPSIRVWIPKCSDPSDLSRAVRALKPTLEYAASRNVVVNLENDNPVNASAARSLAAIKLADTPYLRALPDFGNGLMAGDERFNAQAVKDMFVHAWNIAHVKDCEIVRGQRKTASLAELFGIAKASGYRGYFSMESESGLDPIVDTKHLLEQSLALL
jgi:sugar phosphate isomerase/epimerase